MHATSGTYLVKKSIHITQESFEAVATSIQKTILKIFSIPKHPS